MVVVTGVFPTGVAVSCVAAEVVVLSAAGVVSCVVVAVVASVVAVFVVPMVVSAGVESEVVVPTVVAEVVVSAVVASVAGGPVVVSATVAGLNSPLHTTSRSSDAELVRKLTSLKYRVSVGTSNSFWTETSIVKHIEVKFCVLTVKGVDITRKVAPEGITSLGW